MSTLHRTEVSQSHRDAQTKDKEKRNSKMADDDDKGVGGDFSTSHKRNKSSHS